MEGPFVSALYVSGNKRRKKVRKCGQGDRDRLKNVVVAESNVDEVVVVLGTIGGKLLSGVIFAMYNAVADVFFQLRDVFEVVEGVFF